MAKVLKTQSTVKNKTPKKKRPGVHSKTHSSANKNSKNYKKPYIGQGK